jgi:ABC-2 type transport system ATP-binding protein
MAGREMIVLEGLGKVFDGGWPWKKHVALRGVDLVVREGETLGYLGPNGAGKTTTLKLMVGLLRPSSGSVLVAGHPPADARARRLVGFLPENPYFYEYLTGREFLTLAARLGTTEGHAPGRQALDRLLDQVGLLDAADRPLRKYSKGMLQRIGLAQALVNDPPILILDEPMSGLDPVGRREIRDLILDLRRQGKTILFSTHILADVELVCDRVTFLDGGRLLADRSLADLVGGEGDPVEVKVGNIPPERLGEADLPVRETIRGGEGIILVLDDPGGLCPLLARVEALGGKVLSVSPRRRSLEDLFLHLVGRKSP